MGGKPRAKRQPTKLILSHYDGGPAPCALCSGKAYWGILNPDTLQSVELCQRCITQLRLEDVLEVEPL